MNLFLIFLYFFVAIEIGFVIYLLLPVKLKKKAKKQAKEEKTSWEILTGQEFTLAR